MAEIPVYLIAGFLDGGKTNYINSILEDGFAEEDRTLLLCCEEGEEEYNPDFLNNVTVVTVEEKEELNPDHLAELEAQYQPKQVLVELNGMWPMDEKLMSAFPENWEIYQIMTFVDSSTFEVYAKNLGQLMMEKIINADLIMFNRCTPELRDALRARNLRIVNRVAEIYLEYEDGSGENYFTGDEHPFDLDQDVIHIPDDDFGLWYVDVMDHPERYDGKTVHMKLVMCHSQNYPGIHCPGRFVMICCENDITFMGLIARGDILNQYQDRDWIEVEAKMSCEEHPAYDGVGPVMNILSAKPCEKAEQDVVTF